MKKLFGGTILALLAIQPASADFIFTNGNVQYTNVNVVAAVNVPTIIGTLGSGPLTMTFGSMIGPDGTTSVDMHGQNGVAFVQSYADSLPNATDTGFSSITLLPELGYAFTAGDFKLAQLNSLLTPTGFVTFHGRDQFGNLTSTPLSISQDGQNPYNFYTQNGELVTSGPGPKFHFSRSAKVVSPVTAMGQFETTRHVRSGGSFF